MWQIDPAIGFHLRHAGALCEQSQWYTKGACDDSLLVQVVLDHKAVQVCMDGAVPLAELLAESASAAADAVAALAAAPSLPEEPVSRTASHLRMLRGAARLVGLNAAARRHALQAQLTRLEELRKDVVRKMNSKAVKDSLRELRKYRRPPRAAAQV